MVANNDLLLTNNADSKTIAFRGVNNYRVRKVQPPVAIPLINTSPQNTFIFKFIGQSEEISFEFAIFDDGADVAVATPDTIITVADQIQYIKDTIYVKDFDGTYTFTDTNSLAYSSGVTVFVTALEINLTSGANTLVTGTITMQRGTLGNLT